MPGKLVDAMCAQCTRPFRVLSTEIKRGAGRFCSHLCAGAAVRRAPNTTCAVCGAPFHRKASHAVHRATCSRRCMALSYTKERPTLTCARCGEAFAPASVATANAGRTFCSVMCRNRATSDKPSVRATTTPRHPPPARCVSGYSSAGRAQPYPVEEPQCR